jgi:hypothetical protein
LGEPETVTVDDTYEGSLGSFSDSGTAGYSRTEVCSSTQGDYTDGFYTESFPNTASINETTGDNDSETVTLNCYAPVVEKDADTEWFREVDWTITKDVTPPSADRFAGQSATYDYTVTLTKTVDEFGYRAFGTIDVTNPVGSPGDMTVDVADAVDGLAAAVDCDGLGGTSLTVAPGATGSCEYTVDLAGTTQLVNTATVTFNTIDFTDTADVIFGAPIHLGEPETVTVDDTYAGSLGSFSDSDTTGYSRTEVCSSLQGDYTDGFYTESFPNTASINETTGDSDSETVTLNCYAPVVEKDADTEWFREFTWNITKDYDGTYELLAGESVLHSYLVTVGQSVDEYGYRAFGTIDVTNPSR